MLLHAAAQAAAVGIAAGLFLAVREVAAGPYLAYRLWLDVLRIVSRDTFLGAAAGAVAAAAMSLSFVVSQARRAVTRPPAADPSSGGGATAGTRSRLIAFFAVGAAATVLCTPTRAPLLLGLSHWVFLGIGLALVCVALARAAAPATSDVPSHVALVWPTILAFGLLVCLVQVWSRAGYTWDAAVASTAAALVALLLHALLHRPATVAAARLRAALLGLAWPAMPRVPMSAIAGTAVLWAVASLAAHHARLRTMQTGKNVLLIAVDALRYDAVSLLAADEHDRDLTPELREQLASRGTVFTEAYSQAPWTLPAFSSMFTGRYPEQHRADRILSQLEPSEVTLAELLGKRGYATMAIVSGYFLTKQAGATQGFARVDESQAAEGTTTSSPELTDRALRFLETAQHRRFFLFVHYNDPHNPYLRHPEVRQAVRRRAKPDSAAARAESARGGWTGMAAGRVAGMRSRYASEVAFTDRHIGRLLRFLGEHDLWKSTCVILVADHGDEFLEHGSIYHSRTLFQEVIHVPLAIAAPGSGLPRIVAEPVETRWLFGTILDAAGVASGPGGAAPSLLTPGAATVGRARSSLAAPGPGPGVEDRAGASPLLSSLTGKRYKLIRDHLREQNMLFDLRLDPIEQHDLSQEQPELAARLERELAAAEPAQPRTRSAGPVRRLREEELRRLRGLGYL